MTNSANAQLLAKIDARREAATPGIWVHKPSKRKPYVNVTVFDKHGHEVAVTYTPEDAVFVCHAKLDSEWMSERIKALETEREELRQHVIELSRLLWDAKVGSKND